MDMFESPADCYGPDLYECMCCHKIYDEYRKDPWVFKTYNQFYPVKTCSESCKKDYLVDNDDEEDLEE